MASVLSLQQGWSESEQPQFKGKLSISALQLRRAHAIVNGQFKPLRDSVNSGESEQDDHRSKAVELMK